MKIGVMHKWLQLILSKRGCITSPCPVRVLFIDSINTKLRETILTSSHDNGSDTTGKTSDEITGKAGNEMRQVRTHTWAPGTSLKLKSLQDLSIKVNPEVTEEVVHHAGL
jgi:hypothetical protein